MMKLSGNKTFHNKTLAAALAAALTAALAFAPCGVNAADFPKQPINLTVVFSPGGALDGAARILAQEAEKELGQKIIIQNQPGAGGLPGVAKVASSPADGYTLGACVSNALLFIPHKNPAPYRPLRDIEPIFIFGQATPVLVTNPAGTFKNMDEFLAASQEKAMKIGVPGLGSPSHVALALIQKRNPALKWNFVPYGGPGEAEAALLGGHLDASATGALGRVKKGELLPLMTLGGKLASLPETPSLDDRSYGNITKGDSLFVFFAPAGVDNARLDTLEAAFEKAAQSAGFQKVVNGYSVSPLLYGRTESKKLLRNLWTEESKILKEVGLADHPATPAE